MADGEPLASSPDPEIAWANVAAHIERAVVVERLTRPSVTPGKPRRASAAGQVRVSGVVLRSGDRTLIDECGRSARDQVVAQMPEHCRDDLRQESIDLLARYDLEKLTTYMDLATSLVLRDLKRWRDFGRLAVSGDLHQFVRAVYHYCGKSPGIGRKTAKVAKVAKRREEVRFRHFPSQFPGFLAPLASWRFASPSDFPQ